MTYIGHLHRQLANAKREAGEAILALADDSARKLDDECADRQVILEDLITRLCLLSEEFAPGSAMLFESLDNYRGSSPRMPIEPAPLRPHLVVLRNETTGNGKSPVTISPETIREVHNTTSINGVQRHPFESFEGASGFACTAMVMRNGSGEDCGLGPEHDVHDIWESK